MEIRKKLENFSEELLSAESEARQVISRQLEDLAQESELPSEEAARLHSDLRDEIEWLKAINRQLKTREQQYSAAIDEMETRLNETEALERRRKKKFKLIPAAPTNAQIDLEERKQKHFAQGLTFYKLFWVFFIGCFVGVVVEIFWCLITRGHYESRAGLIYGPFNLVYGFGAGALSACLYKFRNRSKLFSFVGGFLVGSVVEYACSWVQEMMFGSTSWDYSHLPFNINGRICLLYSVFWGLLGVLWIKDIYPRMSKWILKIPNRFGKGLTWALLVFMVFNSVMTALTVYRWSERREGAAPGNAFETYLDRHYPDERMQKIFANMVFPDDPASEPDAEPDETHDSAA